MVGTAGQVEHSIGQLLRLDADGWNGCVLYRRWDGDCLATHVRLDVGYRDAKRIVAPIADAEVPLRSFFMIPVRVVMKIGGKLHTTELLVAAIRLFLDGVSQQGGRNKRLDAYDFILIVDRALDPKLSHRICEDVPLLSETAFA